MTSLSPEIAVVPSAALPSQPWTSALHSMIISSFKRKDIQAFPPSWTRLHPNPIIGIERLAEELGVDGYLAVLLLDGIPSACGGLLPFRGIDWINKEKSAEVGQGQTASSPADSGQSPAPFNSAVEWEICCFCVHEAHRRRGLSRLLLDAILKAAVEKGGSRLFVNYSRIETGDFWPRMGFEPVPGATSVLKKGFTHTAGMEGLREDIHFQVASIDL